VKEKEYYNKYYELKESGKDDDEILSALFSLALSDLSSLWGKHKPTADNAVKILTTLDDKWRRVATHLNLSVDYFSNKIEQHFPKQWTYWTIAKKGGGKNVKDKS